MAQKMTGALVFDERTDRYDMMNTAGGLQSSSISAHSR